MICNIIEVCAFLGMQTLKLVWSWYWKVLYSIIFGKLLSQIYFDLAKL